MLALLRASQSCRRTQHVAVQAARSVPAWRAIHATPVAMKKKKKAVDEDDLFGDDAFADDAGELFTLQDTAAASKTSPQAKDGKGRLNEMARQTRFQELREFVNERIGKNPPAKLAKKPEQVRNTAWQHLFSLANSTKEMEMVVEMMPRWRDAKRVFTPRMTEAFIRRCEELRIPTLALQVFADHSKYGIDLPNERAARQLLHSLHDEHPLQASITLSALLAVYKLPPVSDDLVSCAMLTSACFKADTPQSRTVAHALLPSLQGLLADASPEEWRYPEDPHVRNQSKQVAWLTWTLSKIEKALEKQKQPYDWLRKWREESGHVQVANAS